MHTFPFIQRTEELPLESKGPLNGNLGLHSPFLTLSSRVRDLHFSLFVSGCVCLCLFLLLSENSLSLSSVLSSINILHEFLSIY